ncbi:hypothetical protein G6F65_019945 [Rhizopus arrhizus]|nr:hypothetical protein G6F65_019945 [Rhizopus arrhizus]
MLIPFVKCKRVQTAGKPGQDSPAGDLPWTGLRLFPLVRRHDRAKAQVRHSVQGVSAPPCTGPVADAIRIAAQERAAARDALRCGRGNIAVIGIEAVCRSDRVLRRLAVLGLDAERIGAIPVGRPLPDVARHVV